MFSGLLKYFPDALEEVAFVSHVGNEQHNPGQPLHWDRSKSTDDVDAAVRHLKDRAAGRVFDEDETRHLAKAAWRILATLQKEIEAESEVYNLNQCCGAEPTPLWSDILFGSPSRSDD